MSTLTSKDGTTIAFDTVGDGPPLVIVGGALSDRRGAATHAALLGSNFTVSTYDRRGRGDSGDTPPYAVEREIEDLQALVEEAGGTAYALGHSSGAVLALEAAAGTPGITKLVLYEPPFIVDDSRPPLPDGFVRQLEELVAKGHRDQAVEYFMTVGVGAPAETIPPMKDSPFWPSLEAMAHTISYDVRARVIDGGASPPSLRNAVQALVNVLPNARRLTLEGQTHEVDPTVLTPVLVDFFTS